MTLRAVTFGPFPGGMLEGGELREELRKVVEVGFEAVRLYEWPSREFLGVAEEVGLWVFAGLAWESAKDFRAEPGSFSRAKVALVEGLRSAEGCAALAGVFVGNEIPMDLVRWMGAVWVREKLEELIEVGREVEPSLLFAYANYPSTEFLEPENADFSAMNVYLEDVGALSEYLRRLQHVAGDRPLMLSEFGLDTRRNGEARQRDLLVAALGVARECDVAGMCVYAWSDRWWNAGAEVLDWDFGLFGRDGREKSAVAGLREIFSREEKRVVPREMMSVMVCTRNGRGRIGACLEGVLRQSDGNFEVIVVDDGSGDGTGEWVRENFHEVRCVSLAPCGLSAARNEGARLAKGEILVYTDDDCVPDEDWLVGLRKGFFSREVGMVGGPNLAPKPQNWEEAVVQALPGAATHVMLDDEEAEHLPGCNLAVRREVFEEVGGFREKFHTAGDDVDFCWRVRGAGYELRFVAGAFVWHWRRGSCVGFLRQQVGYGKAERLLREEHNERFTENGDAIWEGVVYQGSVRRAERGSVIYHGAMGLAGYQGTLARVMPLREIRGRWRTWWSLRICRFLGWLQPLVRAWARRGRFVWWSGAGEFLTRDEMAECREWALASRHVISREEVLRGLLARGWVAGGDTSEWDLEREGVRLLLAVVPADAAHGSVLLVRLTGAEDGVVEELREFVKFGEFRENSDGQD